MEFTFIPLLIFHLHKLNKAHCSWHDNKSGAEHFLLNTTSFKTLSKWKNMYLWMYCVRVNFNKDCAHSSLIANTIPFLSATLRFLDC